MTRAATLILAAVLSAPAAGAAEPPRPNEGMSGAPLLRVGAGEVLGYVAVPNLETLLAHVEAAGNAVAPAALPPGAARDGLAKQLGIPGLEGLAAKPILLVLLKGQGPMSPPRPVLFLPVKDAKTYEATVTKLGWKSRTAGGLLIAASTADGLAASAPLEADYKRIVSAGIGHDLRVFLEMGRLVDAYGLLMQMGLDTAMAPKPSPSPAPKETLNPAAAALLKAEVKAFVALLGQMDAVQWDMDLQGENLTSDTVLTTRAGTALQDLAGMAPAGANRAAALLSGAGPMTATYQVDAARLAAFVGAIVRECASDPGAAAMLTPGVLAVIDEATRTYGGQAAYRMAVAPGGRLSVEAVLEVTDEARTLALVEKGLLLLAPGGAWATLIEDAHISMALQKAARRHAGVTVHRLKVKQTGKLLTPEEKIAQAPFMRDTEFAITHGFYLSAQDAAGLDALIDRAAAASAGPGLTLRSAQAFGEGRHAYVDYDIVGLMKAVAVSIPSAKGAPNPFAALPDTADPTLSAVTFADGRIRWQSTLPLGSFALVSETMKKAAPASPAPPPKVASPPKPAPSPSPRARP